MPNLSKSKYFSYWQCPKKLWLETYKASEREPDDPSTLARMESGTRVGKLAHQLFPNVVDATVTDANGNPDTAAMIARTQQLIDAGTSVIAEAAFSYNGCYCAVDLLRSEGDGWAIYEVKSSTYPEFEGNPEDIEKYVPDITYQKWLLTQCGVNVTDTYLVCLNSDYFRHGELDMKKLFVIIDMKEQVTRELLSVPANVERAMKTMELVEEPMTDLGMQCHKPYPCAFWQYCTRHLPQPSVFNVYGGSGRGFTFEKKLKCYREGNITFGSLRDKSLGNIQDQQVSCALDQREHIDRDEIRNFLAELSYPLYFLDFESMQDAVPQYDDTKPYSQLCFQYSLHIKKSAETPYEHREYLAPSDGSDPRRELAEQLCRDIPKDVCTLVYNKTFECSRIKEMAAIFPDLAEHLLNIEANIKDLLVPFRKGYYYVPAMGGSFSIKSVLPALFPDEPSLNYHNLDERVQNGGDAMTIFPKIKDMDLAEAAATREALLRYCELDTWAMVKVWEQLQKIII